MIPAARNTALVSKRFRSEIAHAMKRNEIVPKVIGKAPKEQAEIIYPCGDKVHLGNELTPTKVKLMPAITWNADKRSLYTICMIDPDAPSRKDPKFKEWIHWLVGNIPGAKVQQGEILSDYIGSAPPKGSGLHRYIFLVFEQRSRLTFGGPRLTSHSAEKRGGFSIQKFREIYHLGNPVAGNFFQAQYDDYVPILYKKLGVDL